MRRVNGNGRSEAIAEIISFARDTILGDWVRFALTALGVLIGTASLIVVTALSLAGKQYLLTEIQSIGSNWIYAQQQSVGGVASNPSDNLTVGDMQAVQHEVGGISAASPVLLPVVERISLPGGKQKGVQAMGVDPQYAKVRNLSVVSGRFFDDDDARARNKVGVMNANLASQLYGSPGSATGKVMKLGGLPFTLIGTFSERVDTFGQSEVSDMTVLIPASVVQYLQPSPMVKQIFFSAEKASQVSPITAEVKRVIQSRHRASAVYDVRNLTRLLAVASKIADAMTLLLLSVSTVVLIVSGIGVMNMMLDRVRERIREIGIRKAVGAKNRDIRVQFLGEAVLISLVGGLTGVVIGFGITALVRMVTGYPVPISLLVAIAAVFGCSALGILFGTVPATNAAKMDPAESLRYE